MTVLITGNFGYAGPVLVRHFRAVQPRTRLVGLDAGYFVDGLLAPRRLPETYVDWQVLGDIRDAGPDTFAGVDAVVHLAGISNDPAGHAFAAVTADVNAAATVELARRARSAGVRSFVFASSCSVYGQTEGGWRREGGAVQPLSAYAISKLRAEQGLARLAGPSFTITSLRLATLCGISPRLRLDLVLNEFVASAIARREIRMRGDGGNWFPLLDVADAARAAAWAVGRPASNGGAYVAVNVGSDEWNFQVRDLALAVAAAIPGTRIHDVPEGPVDRRSYRVDFDLFRRLAPDHQPQATLPGTIAALRSGLATAGAASPGFRQERFRRLSALQALREAGHLTSELYWRDAVTAAVA